MLIDLRMTTNQLFKQIVSEHKWYAPYMSVQQASRIKRMHHNNKHKSNFYVRFFARFGYTQNEVTWKK